MTPATLLSTLSRLHWTQRGLADLLGVDKTQVRRWTSGEYPVPAPIAAWLERVVRWLDRNPPPAKRSTRKE